MGWRGGWSGDGSKDKVHKVIIPYSIVLYPIHPFSLKGGPVTEAVVGKLLWGCCGNGRGSLVGSLARVFLRVCLLA